MVIQKYAERQNVTYPDVFKATGLKTRYMKRIVEIEGRPNNVSSF